MFDVNIVNSNQFITDPDKDDTSEAYRIAQWCGSKCYQPDLKSQMLNASKINVKNTLWKPGHHTTLEHANHHILFDIENIPVSLVTFGLHMTHPFYNSSQRSGRYCLDIFGSDLVRYHDYINNFLDTFYTDCQHRDRIIDWFTSGFVFFKLHLDELTQLAKEAILAERPHYALDIDTQAKRIAQEQLRIFISTIVPTGLVYTINIPTLYAMYKTAWNKPLEYLLDMMEKKFSFNTDLSFRDQVVKSVNYYTPPFAAHSGILPEEIITNDVHVSLLNKDKAFTNTLKYISEITKGSLDTTFFDPYCIPNMKNDSRFSSTVSVPVVTYGQDQRHRMIKRSNPTITGEFYLPQLVEKLPDARSFSLKFMNEYNDLVSKCGRDIMLFFIPYGAMVKYNKECDVRAYLHSVNKRLCFNAERTICNMEHKTLQQLFDNHLGGEVEIGPPCQNDKCPEGKRFCGRDLQNRKQRILI